MTKLAPTRQSGMCAEIIINKHPGIDYKKALSFQGAAARGRSSTEIADTKKQLRIVIKASDVTALRASMNAMMRDIQVLESVVSVDLGKKRGAKHRAEASKTEGERDFRKM